MPKGKLKRKEKVNNTVLQELKVATYPPFLNHQNITQVLGIENVHWSGECYALSLVSEFSEIGSLAQFFGSDLSAAENNGCDQKRAFAVDVTSGLEVLHSCRVIHADLKPENVLLFKNTVATSNVPLMAKLSDFGSTIIEDTVFLGDLFRGKRPYRGTPVYLAPFVREVNGDIPFHTMPKGDMYSLGLLIWSIYKNQHYFLPAGKTVNDIDDDVLLSLTEENILLDFESFLRDAQSSLPATEIEIIRKAIGTCIRKSAVSDQLLIPPVDREQVYRKAFSEVTHVKRILKVGELRGGSDISCEADIVQQPFHMSPYTYDASGDVPWELQTQLRQDLLRLIEDPHNTSFQKGRAALQLSSYSATGFGCKKDISEALEFLNCAATFKNQSAQLLIHRVCEAQGESSPALKPDQLPPCSQPESEASDYESGGIESDADLGIGDDPEEVEMADRDPYQPDEDIQSPGPSSAADDQDMVSPGSVAGSDEELDGKYATFHLSAAIDREFKKQAQVVPADWYCWNVRHFMHLLADLMKDLPLFAFGKQYIGLEDEILLSDALEVCARNSIPTAQFRYDDGTRSDVSILHHAAGCGALEVVKTLVKKGANVDLKGLDGKTSLYVATECGQKEITLFLINSGASASIPTPSGQYPLHRLWMFENHDVGEIASRLVHQAGADISASMGEFSSVTDIFYGQQFQGTALHAAVRMRNQAAARALLDLGADVNSRPFGGMQTPLEMAAMYNMPEMVKILLDYGARLCPVHPCDPWALHHVGRHVPPLQRWLLHGSSYQGAASEVIQVLLGAADHSSFDVNAIDETGLTAMEVAIEEPGEDDHIVKAFLDCGFSLPYRAILHAALSCALDEINASKVDLVLSCGAILTAVDKDGLNVLHLSAQHGSLAAVRRILREPGAQDLVQSRDNEGKTPLHWAAATGRTKILEVLIEAGADLEARDLYSVPAVGLAIEMGSSECATHLLHKDAEIWLQEGPWSRSTILNFAVSADLEDPKSMLSFLLSADLNEEERPRFARFHDQAVLNAQDQRNGNTVLHRAAACGDFEGVFSLVRAGASLDVRNSQGRVPLQEAERERNLLIIPTDIEGILLRQRLDRVLQYLTPPAE
ncbi:MAG: hypothetical protein M1816_003338 [Peltula sp. TS41687]|nr:MAG: hypothetical protein M1816_003338 [Peltula sp. TS41687]